MKPLLFNPHHWWSVPFCAFVCDYVHTITQQIKLINTVDHSPPWSPIHFRAKVKDKGHGSSNLFKARGGVLFRYRMPLCKVIQHYMVIYLYCIVRFHLDGYKYIPCAFILQNQILLNIKSHVKRKWSSKWVPPLGEHLFCLQNRWEQLHIVLMPKS